MDNANLNDLILNSDDRQFWLKPWGNPDRAPDEEEQFFTSSKLTIGFSKQPNAVEIGDILIVHRIKISKIMLVAEVISSVHHATDEKKKKNPLLNRWAWSVEAKNLTPEYGAQWFEHSLKTFALANEYNKNSPDKVKLGSIQFGNDKLRIPEEFGKFVIKEIQRLEE
ncbi:MAG: hypothetical protein KIS76_06605 [Pyrinomonadaceae bacterium]|nr:hypothetical protein [Pyrinomonadaceae bacterium]